MSVSAGDVEEWIASTTGGEVNFGEQGRALITKVIAAIEAHAAQFHEVPDPVTPDWDLAVLMYAARLWDRRNSPGGIAGIGEFGAVRITRIDPDIDAMFSAHTQSELLDWTL